MSTSLRLVVGLAGGAILALSITAAPPELPLGPAPTNIVIITLRPDVAVSRTRAYIDDVALLEGGDAAERTHLGRLDLVDLPVVGAPVLVSREQVMYRLLLAGIDRSRFELEGSAIARVSHAPAPPASAGQLVHVGHREPAEGTKPAEKAPSGPILINRRDNVEIVLRIGELQVTARGEALQDGRAGERISVRNIDSNRVVHGRVVDRSVVEIDFNGSKP